MARATPHPSAWPGQRRRRLFRRRRTSAAALAPPRPSHAVTGQRRDESRLGRLGFAGAARRRGALRRRASAPTKAAVGPCAGAGARLRAGPRALRSSSFAAPSQSSSAAPAPRAATPEERCPADAFRKGGEEHMQTRRHHAKLTRRAPRTASMVEGGERGWRGHRTDVRRPPSSRSSHVLRIKSCGAPHGSARRRGACAAAPGGRRRKSEVGQSSVYML